MIARAVRGTVLFLVIALCASMAISGCAGKGAEEPSILRVAIRAEPDHFDQWFYSTGNLGLVPSAFFDGLVIFDEQANSLPHLAESWERIAPGHDRFRLREGLVTHEGHAVDAEFIKRWNDDLWYSDPKSPQCAGFHPVTVEVVDALTVDFFADMLLEDWLLKTALPYMLVYDVNHRQGVGPDEFGRNPSGTGPFILKEWIRGERIVAVANDNYFLGRPLIDELHFYFIPDPATQIMALEAGEVDMIDYVPAHELKRLHASPDFDTVIVQEMRPASIMLNLQDPIMGDVRVRRGLAHAMNRQEMVESQTPLASPTEGHVHPGVQGYVSGLVLEHDPVLAERLLNEAGWRRNDKGMFAKGDKLMEIQIKTARGEFPLDYELAEMVQLQLTAFGVMTTIQVYEPRAYFDMVVSLPKADKPEFQGLTWFFGVRNGIPTVMYDRMYSTGGFYNVGHFSSQRYDQLVALTKETTDRDVRLDAYREMQQIIHDEVLQWTFFTTNIGLGINPKVKGFAMSPPQNTLWHKVSIGD